MRLKRVPDILALTAYILLIYGTLSISPGLYGNLERLFAPRFDGILTVTLLVAPIILLGFFYGSLVRRDPIVYLGIAGISLTYAAVLLFLTGSTSEKSHLILYGFLSYLALKAFRGTGSNDRVMIYVILTLVIVGFLDEFIQMFLPNRYFGLQDVYLNVLGGLLGILVIRLLDRESR